MNYEEAVAKILDIPMFQNVGESAFIPTLKGSVRLNKIFNNPYNSYHKIHVAGTNGKGSVSNMLTSILMEEGYKVGCYTSPHLLDYRERVRINGVNVSKNIVCDFMDKLGDELERYKSSFFEVTTALAFYAFEVEQVDIAIIETGLGGETDSTNIITPILSVITNISLDHVNLLGNKIVEIARQKGGIIKDGVPVVIGERSEDSDSVFKTIAEEKNAEIIFAEDNIKLLFKEENNQNMKLSIGGKTVKLSLDLAGEYQSKNLVTVLSSIKKLNESGVVSVGDKAIERGLLNISQNSSFAGRWQKISDSPLTICDTGHNESGLRMVLNQLSLQSYDVLYMVVGFMADKEIESILKMFPKDAHYLFATASNPRSIKGEDLKQIAERIGLVGESFDSVNDAYDKAKHYAKTNDMIFIGGSTFVVADVLRN